MDRDNRGWWIALVVLVAIVLLVPTLGGGMMGWAGVGPGMMGRYTTQPPSNGWAWGLGMGLGGLVMLAFWGAVIAGIVLLVRSLSSGHVGPPAPSGESPIDILKRRHAAGEITLEEYERTRKVLER